MKFSKPIFIVAMVMILILASCNLPSSTSDEQPLQEINTSVALTLTSRALLTTQTPSPTSTQTLEPTTAITLPTATAAPVQNLPSATPNGSFFVVDIGANCRSGPDTVYDKITSFAPGAYLSLAGRNNDKSWWYVLTGSTNCWISASTGHTTGSVDGLSVIAAPPTPTAVASNGPLLTGPTALVAEMSYPSNCTSNMIQVAIRVTDNGNGVDSVWLKYRYLSDGGYTGSWHTVTANDNASGGVNGFMYTIGAEAAGELGTQNGTFQYQFFAKDNAGNTSSYPNGSVLGMPIKYCP
ncbi:MAG: hypothetical protein IPP66_14605 [Anaerolineales bacterium]|nr:hypothetical protein [Anaerolineales bacterium]